MIVTIDGPAGSGKSTVAKQLAVRLGVRFLDTGAMYRAVALAVLNENVNENNADEVEALAANVDIKFQGDQILLNDVTAISSVVAANPTVRKRLVELQRQVGNAGSLVTEGRDQGSVVFPKAEFKFFLTANLDVRARRRHKELVGKGSSLTLSTVKSQLSQRDDRDENRTHAPLKPAADAEQIDTSYVSITQLVDRLVETVQGQSSAVEPSETASSSRPPV
ncbi:UNVERIFIED_CONTAM: hypothetical protein GTU68_027765 [Idotea baltica]|nr:hypothetical protein [Idotea baltica]